MTNQWPPMPHHSEDNYNLTPSAEPSPVTSPQHPSARSGSIATRINQLREVFQANSTPGGSFKITARRRENSRTGFGKRQSNKFAGPALRNSRLDEQPDTDGTHYYLGPPPIARTNHLQEHATTRKTSNWEKTTGLHGQLQPTGIEHKANEPARQWDVPLETKFRPKMQRKYDRNGNLVRGEVHDTDNEQSKTKLQVPTEYTHVSKHPSLSTVLESQLLERKDEIPTKPPLDGLNETSMQSYPTRKERVYNTRLSSSHKSTVNETPLSTKRKSVREMYDYYGIQRPAELCSDYGKSQAAQPIRVQRDCHVCGWINGPDNRCWKCQHRFCEKCDEISPNIFFQATQDNTPQENFEATANPIKLSLLNFGDQRQDTKRQKLTRKEASFALKYPYINIPEPLPTSPLKDTRSRNTHLRQSSGRRRTPISASSRQAGNSKKSPTPTSERGVDKIASSQPQGSGLQRSSGTKTSTRDPGSKSSTYQPRPIYISDIPRRSPMAGKPLEASQLQKTISALPFVKNTEQTPLYPLQSSDFPQLSQDPPSSKAELPHGHPKRQGPTSLRMPQNLMTSAPVTSPISRVENPLFKKTMVSVDPQRLRLRPKDTTVARNGSPRHRRLRRHANGSQPKSSSSSKDRFSCESPGCQATHDGHRPYRHSISCTRNKYRVKKDTDSGYIASRSHNDDPIVRMTNERSSNLGNGGQDAANNQQNWRDSLKVHRERLSKKKITDCAQCYGYLNNCRCETCASIHRVMNQPEHCPPRSTDGGCSAETQVFMPQPQKIVPNPEKLDPPLSLSIEPRTLRDASNTHSAFDEQSFVPMANIEKTLPTSAGKEAGCANRKVAHEKVKGDTLGKPIPLGYEPLPKVPLYSVSYTTDESSALTTTLATLSSKSKAQALAAPAPGFSDPPTPVTEKAKQNSFFTSANKQSWEVSVKPDNDRNSSATVRPNLDSNQNETLDRAWRVNAANPLLQTKPDLRADSRRDFEILRDFETFNRVKRSGLGQDIDSTLKPGLPGAAKNLVRQPDQPRDENKISRKVTELAKIRTPEPAKVDQDDINSSKVLDYPLRPRSAEISPLGRKSASPTPASRDLSAILERNVIPILEEKIKQQQYELDRITKLLDDHFAEISSQSQERASRGVLVSESVSLIEKGVSPEKAEEKVTETEVEKERGMPWKLNLFEGKDVVESGGPRDPLGEQSMEECDVGESPFGGNSAVELEAQIDKPTTSLKIEDIDDRNTPTPKILVREPTLVSNNPIPERESGETSHETLSKSFTPSSISLSSRKSTPKGKQSLISVVDGNSQKGSGVRSVSCKCGILGVTVIIHLEGGEDKVVRGEVRRGGE